VGFSGEGEGRKYKSGSKKSEKEKIRSLILLISAHNRIVYDGDGNRVSETAGSTTTKHLIDDLEDESAE
jgi:hypothetical protein